MASLGEGIGPPRRGDGQTATAGSRKRAWLLFCGTHPNRGCIVIPGLWQHQNRVVGEVCEPFFFFFPNFISHFRRETEKHMADLPE